MKKDNLFLEEIYRVLKPNGTLILSTPNKEKTITKNPWHIREYNDVELKKILKSKHFKVEKEYGIFGNQKVENYFEMNKINTLKIIRLDFFNIRRFLPPFLYKIIYEFFNRVNRIQLMKKNPVICSSITHQDFNIANYSKDCLDLFFVVKK
ncbi:hypothetical protein GOQ30_07670 [Flavobacterium sp. TP390]|uniref:Methyltransferase type 11 domain-containing protein n=1 Tax=Flavobacterium profundi TaxID=1774945 RepID=A0A6I4IH80_9FLAO|nr:class I SAM-dependent methyltransferase [Flavobacterium profundi]MVO09043.1 hypothetical protein [Flavobacterium profundi]